MKLPMKLLRIVGLCLTAIFAVSMFASASASAAIHWEQCSEGTEEKTPTKYTEHQCTTAATSNKGKWQWNEPKTTEAVVIKGSLKLVDKETIAGKSAVECYGESTGIIGPGKIGQTTTVKVEKKNCHKIELCEEVEAVEARNLPWSTELYESEAGKLLEKLVNGTGGEPGWKITCKVIIKGQVDECVQVAGEEESLSLANVNSSGILLVSATFEKNFKAKCSSKGTRSGEVSGSLAVLKANEWGLRIS